MRRKLITCRDLRALTASKERVRGLDGRQNHKEQSDKQATFDRRFEGKKRHYETLKVSKFSYRKEGSFKSFLSVCLVFSLFLRLLTN